MKRLRENWMVLVVLVAVVAALGGMIAAGQEQPFRSPRYEPSEPVPGWDSPEPIQSGYKEVCWDGYAPVGGPDDGVWRRRCVTIPNRATLVVTDGRPKVEGL